MANNIFVSYNFTNREVAFTVKSFSQNCSQNVQGRFVFVEKNVSAEGKEAIDREILRTMKECNAALFIIGNDNHNSPWINREVEIAITKGLKTVVTQLPETNGGLPPMLKNYKLVNWTPKAIADEFNRK